MTIDEQRSLIRRLAGELAQTAGQVEAKLKSEAQGAPVHRVRLSCGLGENCTGLFNISEDLTKIIA